jgi:hypothetical protein
MNKILLLVACILAVCTARPGIITTAVALPIVIPVGGVYLFQKGVRSYIKGAKGRHERRVAKYHNRHARHAREIELCDGIPTVTAEEISEELEILNDEAPEPKEEWQMRKIQEMVRGDEITPHTIKSNAAALENKQDSTMKIPAPLWRMALRQTRYVAIDNAIAWIKKYGNNSETVSRFICSWFI